MSTKFNGVNSKKTGFFSNFFGSSPVVPEASPLRLLDLPRPVRVKIWRLLGFSHTKTLRLVCSLVKEDIDKFTGISSAIDSTWDDFHFHCNIAIRKVVIHELIIPTYIQFLKYPEILQEVEIRGEISVQNFHYVIKSCPNICKLLIVFNKFVLDYRTPFFPLPLELHSLEPLSKLRSLKFISTTKKANEMAYVNQIAISLFRDSLSIVKITSLHVMLVHKTSNEHFRETVWATLIFVHKHVPNLRYLNLTFRDKDVGVVENSVQPQQPVQNRQQSSLSVPVPFSGETHVPPPIPRPPAKTLKAKTKKLINANLTKTKSNPKQKTKTEAGKSTDQQNPTPTLTESQDVKDATVIHPPGTHHEKAIHSDTAAIGLAASPEGEGEADVDLPKSDDSNEESNEMIRNANRYLLQHKWPKADKLNQLWLTMSLKYMEELLNIISPKTKLQILQLDTVGAGETTSNWGLYSDFIQRGNAQSLKNVTLFTANNVNPQGRSLPIDLSVFRNSKNLRRLTILCQKRDDFSKLPHARGVSNLPNTLWEVNFERMLLTPCQVIRLLISFDELSSLSVAYWSISDCQFCTLLTVMKWIVKLDITSVHKVCLVDTKLRFKNKRQAVRRLQEAVSVSAKYQDLDETRLVIDMSEKQDTKSFAPEIVIKRVQIPEQKPQRSQRSKPKVADSLSISSAMTT